MLAASPVMESTGHQQTALNTQPFITAAVGICSYSSKHKFGTRRGLLLVEERITNPRDKRPPSPKRSNGELLAVFYDTIISSAREHFSINKPTTSIKSPAG